jgi:hypothetical protein
MKKLINVQRIHRAGIAAILLAAASVGLSAGSAQARPKNACQSYLHMLDVTKGLEDRAYALYQHYEAIGDDQTASGYEAEFYVLGTALTAMMQQAAIACGRTNSNNPNAPPSGAAPNPNAPTGAAAGECASGFCGTPANDGCDAMFCAPTLTAAAAQNATLTQQNATSRRRHKRAVHRAAPRPHMVVGQRADASR